MKALYLLTGILLYGCNHDLIPMRETPLRLQSVEKPVNENRNNLTLEWQSLDGNIRIVTEAPVEDSNEYVVGSVYARCFLHR